MNWPLEISRRVVRLCLVLAAVAVASFSLAKMSPIDPIDAYLGADIARVGPEQRAIIAAKWGLDKPNEVQFLHWLGNMLAGDLGYSMTYNAPVGEVIGIHPA